MFAAGAGLFVIGYALVWTGVQRFRGNDYSLLASLGMSGAGQTSTLTDSGTGKNGPSSSPSSSGSNVQPSSSSGSGQVRSA